MKKILLATVTLLVIASCSKDKTETPAPPPAPPTVEKLLVKEQDMAPGGSAKTYLYDAQKRIVKEDGPVITYNIEYLQGKILLTSIQKSNGAISSTREILLDASGRATQIVQKDKNGVLIGTETAEYNADGYMIRHKTVYADGDTYESLYTITNGNATKEVAYENGLMEDQTDYFYDEAIPSKVYFVMNSNWMIRNLWGKGYKNEMKGFKRYASNGQPQFDCTRVVTLDADGYVIKRVSTYPIWNQQVETTYTYQ